MRTAEIDRNTLETQISVSVNLDGSGEREFQTGLPFLDHMLDQVARHGLLDIRIKADGDLEIDAHHTVEDIGITLGQAVNEAIGDKKSLENAVADLTLISAQKPVINNARKSIAGFKVRQGWPIGTKVTLRADRMYEFLDRLISIALPRVRDFRGLNTKSFDGTGNYSLGIQEQIVFPEIDFDKIEKVKGMNITITTTAQNDEQGRCLLTHMGLPIRK